MDKKKVYNNIYAYKHGVGIVAILCLTFGSFISFLACMFFIAATVRVNLLYLIGVVVTGVFGLWLLGMFIKKRMYSNLVLKQQDETLYLFPDTKKQVVLSLKDIVGLNKKKFGYLWDRGNAGKLIIISKTNSYSLDIRDLDTIYKRLDENIKQFNTKQ